MAVNLAPASGLLPVSGVRLAAGAAGIRYQGRDDLLLIELAEGTGDPPNTTFKMNFPEVN